MMFLKFLICLMDVTSGFLPVNIAPENNATYCDEELPKFTDGDKITAYEGLRSCDESTKLAYIEIPFTNDNYVSHIIIYHGGRDRLTLRPLPLYYSFLLEEDRVQFHCNEFSKTMGTLEKGMRVNCKYPFKASKGVLILTEVQNISEIEVYVRDHAYRGCVSEFSTDSRFNIVEFDICKMKCKELSKFVMAKNKDKCLCSNDYSTSAVVDSWKCPFRCDKENTIKCGGDGYYSVYLVQFMLPRFETCTLDFKTHNWSTEQGVTVKSCVNRCSYSINIYMGANRCHCTNESRGVLDETCEYCPGEPEKVCGNVTATFYSNCFEPEKYLPCHKLMRCKDNDYDVHGICTKGCVDGFLGDHCLDARGYKTHVIKSQITFNFLLVLFIYYYY